MQKKLDSVSLTSAIFILFGLLSHHPAQAKQLKDLNPNCAACPVAIMYGENEIKGLLKDRGRQLWKDIAQITQKKSLLIDLDGVKRPGSDPQHSAGYELQVNISPDQIVINHLQDLSQLKLVTDHKDLKRNYKSWQPLIYIFPANGNEISKKEDLKSAWIKFRSSALYSWINQEPGPKRWTEKMLLVLAAIIHDNR